MNNSYLEEFEYGSVEGFPPLGLLGLLVDTAQAQHLPLLHGQVGRQATSSTIPRPLSSAKIVTHVTFRAVKMKT